MRSGLLLIKPLIFIEYRKDWAGLVHRFGRPEKEQIHDSRSTPTVLEFFLLRYEKCIFHCRVSCYVLNILTRTEPMTDVSRNVKKAIDKTASAAKSATEKTADAAGKVAKKTGEAIKNAGQKVKDAGK